MSSPSFEETYSADQFKLILFDSPSPLSTQAESKTLTLAKKKRITKDRAPRKRRVRCKAVYIINTNFNLSSPIYENRVFYIFGGILLPIDFSEEMMKNIIVDQEFVNSNCPIHSVEKHQNFTRINFNQHKKGLEDFSFLIEIYEKKGNLQYHQLAQVLRNLQNKIFSWKQHLNKRINIRQMNPNEYYDEYSNFMLQMEKMVNQIDQTKFYFYGSMLYDYDQQSISTKSLGFSKGFLSLLGTDQDQFGRIVLRYGQPFGRAGEEILNSLISSLTMFASNIFQNKEQSQSETVIVTLDGFHIPCKELRSYYIPSTEVPEPAFEMAFCLIEIDISLTILKQLLTERAHRNNLNQDHTFEFCSEDRFEYTMRSQLFIEQHYPTIISADYLQCKYRGIQKEDSSPQNIIHFIPDSNTV